MAAVDPAMAFDLGLIRRGAAVYDIGLGEDNRVLIPDFTQNKVIILDRDLKKILKTLEVPTPHAAIEDSKGFLYVGTHRSGRIKKFDRQYQEIIDWDREVFNTKTIMAPVALADGPAALYVCDWILQRVVRINHHGELLSAFEGLIKAKTRFQPHGLTVDVKRQRVYVADRGCDGGNGAIHSFTLEGRYQATWPKPSADFDPLTVRALTANLMIVPNYTDGAFYIFDDNGRLLEKLDVVGSEAGQLNHAASVISDGKRYIYAPELKGDRIQRIDFKSVIDRLESRANDL